MKPSNILDQLAQKYGTDKFGKHSYTEEYDKIFSETRNQVKKVVELGAAEGAGLKMFHDYFPNAKIYGADIEYDRVPDEVFKDFPRIEDVFICDQAFEKDCKDLIKYTGSDVDLFVDDGSHKPEDQIFTAQTIMPLLDSGAIYIIEDVADRSIFDKFKGFEASMVEKHSLTGRHDDTLIILRHKNG